MTNFSRLFIIVSLLLCQQLNAARLGFADRFEYDGPPLPEFADEVSRYYFEDSRRKPDSRLNIFNNHEQAIKNFISNRKDATLGWFVLGMNYHNKQAAEYEKDSNNTKVIAALTEKKIAAYKAAMESNLNNRLLTARMYSITKNSLNDAARIEAIQNELALGGSGDTETSYWHLHWNNVGSLQDAERFSEAEKALQQMETELKESGLDKSVFSGIHQTAKKQLTRAKNIHAKKKQKAAAEAAPPETNLLSDIKKSLGPFSPLIIITLLILLFVFTAAIYRKIKS